MSINTTGEFENNEVNKGDNGTKVSFDNHIKSFLEEKSIKDVSYFNDDKNLIEKLKSDFKQYLSLQTNGTDLVKSFDEDLKTNSEINNALLKKEFYNKKIEISTQNESLVKNFKSEYDFGDDKLNENLEKLKSEFLKMGLMDLKKLNLSSYARLNFLKEKGFFSKVEVLSKSTDDKIKKIFSTSKFEDLLIDNENSKNLKRALVNLLNSNGQIHYSDLEMILDGFYDEGKFLIVKYFLPTISLKIALESKIITKEQAVVTLKENVSKVLGKNKNLSESELNDIALSIDYSNVNLDLDNIDYSDVGNLVISPIILNNILNEFNESKTENFKTKIDTLEDFITSLENDFEISSDLKAKFKGLKTGKYIKISKQFEGSLEFSNDYLYVGELNSNVTLYNSKSGNSFLSNPFDGKVEKNSYKELFEFIKSSKFNRISLDLVSKDQLDFELQEQNISTIPDLENISTQNDLKDALDKIDPDGAKFKLEDTAYEFDGEDGKKYKGYIKNIDGGSIYLNSGEIFSFKDFVSIFIKFNVKRELQEKNLNQVLESFGKSNKIFNDYIVKNGKIILKSDKDKSNPETFEYIVHGNKAIKFTNIGENGVDFEVGKFAEGNIFKGENPKFTAKQSGKDFGYYDFKETVVGDKLIDISKATIISNTKIIKDDSQDNDKKRDGSLMKRWMGMASIAEVTMGWKHTIGSIESYLKTGNSLKAAKLAKSFGKFFPKSIQDELQVRVESEEKKSMETMMSNLKSKNSGDMVDAMIKILENKDSEQYEIEAALMTMVSKYGTLYNKDLNKYRGSFIWYEALGGKKGDKFYLETKNRCEQMALSGEDDKKNQPIPFTEEYLVECLLAKQVKLESEFKPKRRNKFDKDFGNYLNKGIQEELDDGANKTGNIVIFKGRLDYVLGEFKAGGYANGVGGIENVWGKAGNSMEANAIPFILTYSGIANSFPQPLLKKVTGPGLGRNTPFTTLMFNKESGKIKLYQDAVIEAVKSFQDTPEMLVDLKSANNDVEKLSNFWFKYGKKLEDRLTLKDGFLFGVVNSKKETNLNKDVLKSYIDYMSGIQTDSEFKVKADFISEDKLKFDSGTYMLLSATKPLFKTHIKYSSNGDFAGEGKKLIKAAIDNLLYLKDNKTLDRDYKRQAFFKIYSNLHAAFTQQSSVFNQILRSSQYTFLKQNGLDINLYGIDKKQKYPGDATDDFLGYTKCSEFQEFLESEFEKFFPINDVSDVVSNYKTTIGTTLESIKKAA